MRAFLLVLLLIATGVNAANASNSSLDNQVIQAIQLSKFNFTADDRIKLARSALTYWKNFDSRIPRNSPEDQKWLEEELSVTDMNRINQAVASPQYARMQLTTLSTTCVDLFQSLPNTIGKNELNEAYFWLKIVQCYAHPDATLNFLRTARLSNGQEDGEISITHFRILINQIPGKIANSLLVN
nr:hypothetical protein [Brucella intermedia]